MIVLPTQASRAAEAPPNLGAGSIDLWESFSPVEMAWAVPQHSKDEIDKAGAVLVAPPIWGDQLDDALAVINNWRSSHSFPLNTFQVGLRIKGKQVDRQCLVAQRIKRLSSIELKLRRFKWLKLSDVQDIAGCRAVLNSVRRVDRLVDIYKNSDLKHTLADQDDYIRTPKKSGYRGVHLIYRYHSDKKETYNGLKIEMQFRSPLQHAWATAVETVGTFIRQALKSSQGEKEWLRFFALVASAFALREKTPLVPGTPTNRKELVQELRECTDKLDVETRLSAYGAAMQTLEQPGTSQEAHYFLLALDPVAKRVTITGFKSNQLESASQKYLDVERAIAEQPGAEAVLVSVESLASLRRAYPNYFLDTRVFISALNKALQG